MEPEVGGSEELEARIGHRFANRGLLRRALTHCSFGASHNERLEFLGDALLDFAIARELYERFPRLREGQLSRLRASLVRRETLAAIAREFGLGPELRLGSGESSSGGRERDSTLADALEALIAAIHLDAGMEAALAAVGRWYGERLEGLDPVASHKDPKTELQEYLQARHRALPRYELLESGTGAGGQEFRVLCHLDEGAEPVPGAGPNRRSAEQQAARLTLERLRDT